MKHNELNVGDKVRVRLPFESHFNGKEGFIVGRISTYDDEVKAICEYIKDKVYRNGKTGPEGFEPYLLVAFPGNKYDVPMSAEDLEVIASIKQKYL